MDGGAWWVQSMGSLRVGHDWAVSLSLFTFMHWRRKWQPTPVFLPGESQGRGAWCAAVYGVTQSRTRLKRLSKQASRQAQNTAVSESAVTMKLSILKHSTKPRQESSLQGTQGLLHRCQRQKKSRETRSRVDSKWVAYFCIPNDVKENSNYC